MDIKDLNKSQLLLLAVLLSFVTSIATGITTVTLMQQAPASFTVPVNRVIRQTVEKIQQVEGKTITQTVIVKEEDLVVDAIAKNKSAIFSIIREEQDNIEIPAGFGFAVSSSGIVVADASLVVANGSYYAKNDSGKFKVDVQTVDQSGFVALKIGAPDNGTDKLVFTVPTFGDIEKMKIGQKVLILGNRISSFIFNGNKDLNTAVDQSNAGSIVLDLDGNVLGIALFKEGSSFVSINSISSVLGLAAKEGATTPAAPVLAPAAR